MPTVAGETALANGDAAGAGLVQAFGLVHLQTVGDAAVTGQCFALAGPPTPTPSPTPIPPCIGNCDDGGTVTVDDLTTMINIALGNAEPSVCPDGVPSGAQVDIAVLIQAMNNALYGCG